MKLLDFVCLLLSAVKLCGSLSLNTAVNETPWTNPYDHISSEKLLCKELMTKYHSLGLNGRPVTKKEKPIVVYFGLGLIQMDLDEKSRVLTLSVWAFYRWVDDYLTWNDTDYDNVTDIKLRSNDIWIPDIMLYNTADTEIPERNVHVLVHHSGSVIWVPHRIYRSSCSVDVSNFPFDKQECSLVFGSWTHNKHEIDLQFANQDHHGIDLDTFYAPYKDSCGWEISNSSARREEDANIMLEFTITMKRKMVFSTYILTLPCIFLASLTLVVFCLPPDRPDRTALGMSVFGSFLVLLLILVEAAPPTANSIPLLGVYYCFNMVIIMLSIIFSTVVVNVSRGGDRGKVPNWLKVITVDYMSKALCVDTVQFKYNTYRMCSPQQTTTVYRAPEPDTTYSPTENNDVLTDLPNGNHIELRQTNYSSSYAFENQSDLESCSSQVHLIRQGSNVTTSGSITKDKTGIVMEKFASAMTKKINRENEAANRQNEWKVVANVLDRFFFFFYLTLIIFSLSFFFPKPVD